MSEAKFGEPWRAQDEIEYGYGGRPQRKFRAYNASPGKLEWAEFSCAEARDRFIVAMNALSGIPDPVAAVERWKRIKAAAKTLCDYIGDRLGAAEEVLAAEGPIADLRATLEETT